MNIELVNFNRNFLNYTFQWLQDPELKCLTETPDFTEESQIQWFDSLKDRTNYIIKGIEINGVPIGVAGLKNIDKNGGVGEFFGYIGDKSYWGKGIGKWMMVEIEHVAKQNKLSSIILNVLIENIRAINLYYTTGYKISKFTGNSYKMVKILFP